jgi:branched-chain amino acid transport system permease protein
VTALAALFAAAFLDRFGLYLLYSVAIAATGALALNLLTGYAGQISFAHGALLGVGAYAGGLIGNAGGDVLSLLGAGLATAVVSALIGWPALRLRGLYFAMATLAAQFILEYLFKNLDPVTRGLSGLLIRPLTLAGVPIASDRSFAALAIVALLLAWLACRSVARSDLGRALLVIRESELVAKGIGIDVARAKFVVFLVAGFLTGIAGALFGFATRLAHPETFTLTLSVDYVAMIIVGGLGSLGGSLLGAGFVILLPELLERLGEGLPLADRLFAVREILFGVLIIVFLIFEPRGLRALLLRLRWAPAPRPLAAEHS